MSAGEIDTAIAASNTRAELDTLLLLTQGASRIEGDQLDLLGMLRLVEIQVQSTRRAVVNEARAAGYSGEAIADTLAIDVTELKARYGSVSRAQ